MTFPFSLLTLYRPVQVSDGRHGWLPTYPTATNLWGAIRPHGTWIELTYRNGEDVKVDDVTVADSGCYRVMGIRLNVGAPMRSAEVERIQRPIFPDDESCVGSGSI